MISFAELLRDRHVLEASAVRGLSSYLNVGVKIYLDNGCFSLLRQGGEPAAREYVDYVKRARPNWYPVPADYVPLPSMTRRHTRRLAEKTAAVNREYGHKGFVPVVHVGPDFQEFFEQTIRELQPASIAIGGVVPHIRYGRQAAPKVVIKTLAWARHRFQGSIHVFGLGGGIGSLYLAAALGIDSMDSSGWRVRAARGVVLVPARGDRSVARLGSWGKREPSRHERELLGRCRCRSCRRDGIEHLSAPGADGFRHRAGHNLSVLLSEARMIRRHLANGDFQEWALRRLRVTTFRRFVKLAIDESYNTI